MKQTPDLLAGDGEATSRAVTHKNAVAGSGDKDAAVHKVIRLHRLRVVQQQHLAAHQIGHFKRLTVDRTGIFSKLQSSTCAIAPLALKGVAQLELVLAVSTPVVEHSAVGRCECRQLRSRCDDCSYWRSSLRCRNFNICGGYDDRAGAFNDIRG